MFFDTSASSTAVDGVLFPILTRRVQIGWKSGSISLCEVRRRDQLKAILMDQLTGNLSWGRFANWCMWSEIPGETTLRIH